jgi:hypothetical protein
MKYGSNNGEGENRKNENYSKDSSTALVSIESQRELKEIESLRAHILSYRTSTSPSCRAMKCTLAALNLERDRIMRDEKLKRKFSGEQQKEEEAAAVATAEGDVVMVDGHGRSREVDPTIRASLEILESGEAATTSCNAHHQMMHTTTTAEDEDDEWQDIMGKDQVENPPDEDQPMDGSDSDQQHIGTLLAQTSISSLSEGNVRVSNPLSLIAVAIHAVLRSDILTFQCTGIPPNTTAKVSGFAAPIRELPKTVYLPKDWDSSSVSYDPTTTHHSLGNIVLRYRKKDVDRPMILSVSLLPKTSETKDDNYGSSTVIYNPRHDLPYSFLAQYLTDSKNNTQRKFLWERMPGEQLEKLMVQVTFGPSSTSSNDIGANITFPLGRHVNVSSLMAAIASSQQQQSQLQANGATVPPMLHYKSLSTLLLTFVRSFDVGNVYDSTVVAPTTPKDTEQATVKTRAMESNNTFNHSEEPRQKTFYRQQEGVQKSVSKSDEFYCPKPEGSILTGDEALRVPSRQRDRGGDFAGDLLFTPTDPLMNPNLPLPRPTGNLMGPNHPLFHLQEQYDDDIIGGHRMRPRFDPYGPPGGPTDPFFVDPTFPGRGRANRGRGAGRGGSGDPNPDHLRPPRDFFS